MRIVGVVLAGGRSTRFGSDKALARLNGATLIEHARGKLAAIVSAIAINAPAGSTIAAFAAEKGWPVVSDHPGAPPSPLSGVRAGLAWAAAQGARFLATAPCDAPLMPGDLFTRLAAAIGDAPAACARTPGGLHPLAALWRVDLLVHVDAALGQQRHKPIRALVADWHAVCVDFPDDAPFANVNTPEDLARAAQL